MQVLASIDIFEAPADIMTRAIPAYSKLMPLADEPLNILMIEDVYSDAMIIKITLDSTKISYELSKIRRGDTVLRHLRISSMVAELPDLILLDLGLPGMDGFELLSEISELSATIRHIPIVILTAHKHFEYLQNAYPALHIIGYMNKPCSTADIRRFLIMAHNERNHQDMH